MRRIYIAIVVCVAVAAHAQSFGFQPLPMVNGKDTVFEQYALRLAGPDNANKPTMWQGPLTISDGKPSCTADLSLVTGVYAAPGWDYVLVLSTSGSNAIVHFIELKSCAAKWPAIKRAASAINVEGSRLSFSAECESAGKNAPSQCTSARVYELNEDAPPAFLKPESFKLTRKEIGVGFSGEARIIDPRTPRALIVH
jgi:hypothetical protein